MKIINNGILLPNDSHTLGHIMVLIWLSADYVMKNYDESESISKIELGQM
jgi:hypothetical protein